MRDESEIVESIRKGSVEEFGELVRRYQARVFAILGRYERDYQKVEDLAQQTFLKAWRALHQFDGRAPFEHWISRIAVRVALDHIRKEQRRKHEVHFSALGDDVLEWLRGDPAAAEPDSASAREILRQAMSRLSAEDQLVITLIEIEERSVKEVSALTGWSGVGVRVRAHRARARLKANLKRMTESDER